MYSTFCTDSGVENSRRRLAYVERELSILEASRLMRESGAEELLVTDRTQGMLLPVGVVTARDIVTRIVAAELDPGVLTAGDISWSDEGVEPKRAGVVSPETLRLQESGDASVFAVLDSTGSVAGILTLNEMVRAFARQVPAVT